MDTRCTQGLEPRGSLSYDPVLCSAHSSQTSFQESNVWGSSPGGFLAVRPFCPWDPCGRIPSHWDLGDWPTMALHSGEEREGDAVRPDCDVCFPLPFLRILSFNNLTRLDEESLADLSSLSILRLSHNSISHIAEGAFRGLKSLRVLYVFPRWVGGRVE